MVWCFPLEESVHPGLEVVGTGSKTGSARGRGCRADNVSHPTRKLGPAGDWWRRYLLSVELERGQLELCGARTGDPGGLDVERLHMARVGGRGRSEEHTSELQSQSN